MNIQLYIVSEKYLNYLHTIDKRVLMNHYVTHDRRYVGLGIKLNKYFYFIPLSSPDQSDYDKSKKVKKSIIPIFRLKNTKGEFLSKLLINNMIPVPEFELAYYDIHKEKNENYRNLVLAELRDIQRNYNKICKNAKVLYHQKKKDLPIGYLKATVDFSRLEKAYDLFINNTHQN